MIAAIDIGNTNTHLGIFEGKKLIKTSGFPTADFDISKKIIIKFLGKRKLTSVGISSVVPKLNGLFNEFLKDNYNIKPVYISTKLPLSIKTKLKNHKSVGADRLCSAVYGYEYFKRKHNIIVIDSGTAITYDVVLKNGNYLGGSIAPGLAIMAKSLNQFTSKLPFLNSNTLKYISNPVGRDTIGALRSGIVNSFVDSINGMVERIIKYHKLDFKIILTGGDASFVRSKIKYSVVIRQNCILEGIKLILQSLNGS